MKIRIHDNGTPLRTWLHVDDTCTAILTILEKGNINEIYNISSGYEQTNRETVKKIIASFYDIDLLNSFDYQIMEQYVDYGYTRQGQDKMYRIDTSKIKQLGWIPQKEFDKEIYNIVKHYKENVLKRW